MKKLIVAVLVLSGGSSAYNLNYDVTMSQYKENSSLTNRISFTQQLSRRLALNMDASFTADRSDDLDRFIDSRNGSGRLSWRLSENIEIATAMRRTIRVEERFGSVVQDKVDDTITGEIRYWPTDWLSMDIDLGIHIYNTEYASGDSTLVSKSEGGVRNAMITVNRKLFDLVSTSLTYVEDRTCGDRTDTGNDNITGRMNYNFPYLFNGGYLSVGVGANRNFVYYHDSLTTHREDSWNHSESFVLPEILPDVSMEIGTQWNDVRRFWEEDEPSSTSGDIRDRKERSREIHAGIRWDIFDDMEINISISRDIARNDRKRQGAGVDTLSNIYDIGDNRNLTASLTYSPGESRITFTRVIQLYRYDTLGNWFDSYGNEYQDNNDRDELREVLGLIVEIPLNENLTLNGNLQGQKKETFYLKAEQSANSQVSSLYSFAPGFSYDLGSDWDIRGDAKFSADYKTYIFPEFCTVGSNLLFRNVSSSFSIQKIGADSTQLGISNSLRFQDQGSYENSVFYRSEESLNNTISVFSGFHLSGMGVTPNYSWEYSKRDYPAMGMPSSVEYLHHVGLRTRMSMLSGTLDVQLTRSFSSKESRQSYWRAIVGFNYLF